MVIREPWAKAFTTFGSFLRYVRKRARLTQRDLGLAVGYSVSQISLLENDQRLPNITTLAALFIPALHLQDEPHLTTRLLELAGVSAAQQSEQPKAPRHNLPLQLTSFIGRETEIAELTRFMSQPASARLLTLTGPGGSGKTRLALQVADGQLDHFPDGVWLIELAPLADPALVPQSVAAVQGLREMPGRPVMDGLLDHLRPKRLLLVLDNCEHLIQACAELAEKFLSACPHLTILATSREALGIRGERVYPVPSLSLPHLNQLNSLDAVAQSEAVRLFVERAVVVSSGFGLTRENLSAVVQVCQQLDGIPLAIELAVARLRMLPVEQIAARLDDRFRLLTGGKRTALPRHQTLQALIDWSYDLLTAPEQALLRRLAVFAGGWTLEAAEAVGAGDGVAAGEVFDLLGRLIDKSLVHVDTLAASGEAWYRLLETIRQYALAKLAATGEADALRRQHAAYYLALYERNRVGIGIHDRLPRAWYDRVELELDNLRAALTWSQSPLGNAELGLLLSEAVPSWPVGNTEARGWLEGALMRADAERADNPQARAVALKWLGVLDVGQADYAGARAHLAQSLLLFQELGDSPQCAYVLERLGWLAREQGDAVTARLRLAESLALYRELGDKIGLAGTLNTLGEVAVMQADTAEAAGLLKEGLALNQELENTEGIGWSLNHLGHVAQLQGDYERATRLHDESLPLLRLLGANNGPAWAHQGLGETALSQGDAALASTHLGEALTLFREMGDRSGMAWCLAGLAGVAVLDEEPARAAFLWGAAEALRQSIGAREAPAARITHERLMAAAREQFGEAAFSAAWAEGQAMTMAQAVDEALET